MEADRRRGHHDDVAATSSSQGFPEFEHGQFTFEGEIERLGAFARGSKRTSGWKRGVAVFLALLFTVPIAVSVVALVVALISRALGH